VIDSIEQLKGAALHKNERRKLKMAFGAGGISFLGSSFLFGWIKGALIGLGFYKLFNWIGKKIKKKSDRNIKKINKRK
jgi:hypothetical protein